MNVSGYAAFKSSLIISLSSHAAMPALPFASAVLCVIYGFVLCFMAFSLFLRSCEGCRRMPRRARTGKLAPSERRGPGPYLPLARLGERCDTLVASRLCLLQRCACSGSSDKIALSWGIFFFPRWRGLSGIAVASVAVELVLLLLF